MRSFACLTLDVHTRYNLASILVTGITPFSTSISTVDAEMDAATVAVALSRLPSGIIDLALTELRPFSEELLSHTPLKGRKPVSIDPHRPHPHHDLPCKLSSVETRERYLAVISLQQSYSPSAQI